MRSSLFLAALAAGAVNAYEKRVYVTDWTTVTVTKTVTAPAVTETVTPVQQIQAADTTVSTSTTETPAPVADTTELSKKSTEVAATTEYFSTAWTSTLEASSTMQTSSSSSTSAPASTSSGSSATNSYQQAILYNHNVHRSNHSASSLDWDSELESTAHTLAARCVYEHDTSIGSISYGQNIGYGVKAAEIGQMISNLMYNDEIGYFPTPYGAASPDMSLFEKWGHFSQIVWKSTTHVGCATVMCDSLGNVDSGSALPFTVCNYSPPGNYDGEYGDNVLQPQNQATYTA
ncbi:hypothetical protein N7532_011689 [Penicillium argentinense]|uniref:SCP domain-containing protein n=1 Tax=Penicillium argentinense TaxID=1131581 RepID=A0A9W9EJ53_9EURO|nr:uncharacterized protein N7532_011689 [Penicillium argentinense]KAJ5082646.1 hypothetical protein N7532_011689 [Penicillium argentinense]